MHCPKFLLDLVTEPDNDVICPIRILAIMGFIQFFALASWNYHQHGVFDPQTYALGFGAMITGAGIALGVKKNTSKDDETPKQ